MKKFIILLVVFGNILFAQTAQELVLKNGCLECHAVASKKLAPAFAGIAKKNKKLHNINAQSIILKSIKNGSIGKYRKFSNSQMPSYKNLTNKELNIISEYILSLSLKAKSGNCGGSCSGMKRGNR